MSLRQAARSWGSRLAKQASQHQQRRFAGDLPVKQNKHVEDWATRREHIENEFRWDGKSLANIALWVFAFPYFVYSVSIREFDKVDEFAGREGKREFWGSSGSKHLLKD